MRYPLELVPNRYGYVCAFELNETCNIKGVSKNAHLGDSTGNYTNGMGSFLHLVCVVSSVRKYIRGVSDRYVISACVFCHLTPIPRFL